MKDNGIEVACVHWGQATGVTDTSWIKLIELPNGDLLIVRHDMGPVTLASFDSYDFEHSLLITSADRAQFTAMLLSHVLEGDGPLSWDQLQKKFEDWSVPFTKSERAIT
jgi:hypothetical protein